MHLLRDLPIRRKLLAATLCTCGAALALACAALFWFQSKQFRESFVAELESLGAVVAQNSAAPLAFGDREAAREVLSALKVRPHITSASVYDEAGQLFARYGSTADTREDLKALSPGITMIESGYAHLVLTIEGEDAAPGRLELHAQFANKQRELLGLYGRVLVTVLVGSLGVILVISAAMQRHITQPITALATAARRVTEKRDYSTRAPEFGQDELGLLTRTFNQMLDQIQQRDTALQQAHDELETRVDQRTRELSETNEQLSREIGERKQAEQRLAIAFEEMESKVQERTRELREAKLAAEAASSAKSRFLAMMSHEIRTPLNGVTGMLHLLMHDLPTPRQRRWIDLAQSAADTLLRVINDILDFSKIEAGKLDLHLDSADLHQTVHRTASVFAQKAVSKNLVWTVHIDPLVPREVVADAARLSQVLGNLLGNAVKFTDAGSVSLDVTRSATTDGADRVRFAVTDTGPGLTAAQQECLFKPFSQVDNSSTRRHGGTGLGLGICKQLVELMGGTIGVTSRPGEGSTFWFELAFRHAGAQARSPLVPPPESRLKRSPSAAMSGRVLLVEDNEINQELAREMIRMAGCECECVAHGQDAVRAATDGRYDLVFMDCMMPVMDGYAATRAIRADEASRAVAGAAPSRLPIIAMTANAMEGDREACLAAGMDDYLSKPLDPAAVSAMVHRWLGAGAPGRGGATAEPCSTRYTVSPPHHEDLLTP